LYRTPSSRARPDAGPDTGIFIAGKDVSLSLDMFDAARKAMVPPFVISVFADPAGSFTTAAAMVAKVEKALEKKT
jgi:methylene-tetrahydromethanopterin dehydrogenase